MMKKLELPLHPHLKAIFGSPADAPLAALDWETKNHKLMYDHGLESSPL
ncbi:MAG: hypothetical protein NZN28_03855 [Meiothermus sp.]|nr:hypothetical protein [Meiothermus sp.]MCS7067757.1 hypothetical protein [Meiothermus sp.]